MNNDKYSIKYWDENALEKSKMSSESLYSWHELILEEILKRKWENEKVLDLGCGDGRLTNQLQRFF